MTHGAKPTKSLESDLWQDFRNLVTGAQRIENTISSGMSDVLYPTRQGWFWLELKIRYGDCFYMQRYQLAFAVRTLRISSLHAPKYVVYDYREGLGQLFDSKTLLGEMERHPYDEHKFKVTIHKTIPWITLPEIVYELNALG